MFKKTIKKFTCQYNKLPIVIHPMFFMFGLFCCTVGMWSIFLCYTLSAVLHEVGHFIVARKCGYKMVQLRLMPYGAELGGELDEFIYNDEIKVAFAGPLTSLIIATIIVSFWWLNPNTYKITYDFCISNFVCAIFNILPIFPLDGGRVLVALLSRKLRRVDAIRYAKMATKVFATILFGLFILSCFYTYNLTFGIVAIMLFSSSCSNSALYSYYRVNLSARSKNLMKGLEVVELVVNEDAKVYKVYAKLKSQKFYKFIVVDDKMKTQKAFDELIFNQLEPEDFKKSFKDILLLKYNKKY